MEQLKQFIDKIRSDPKIRNYSEPKIRFGVINPLLSLLKWHPHNVDEVYPEFTVGKDRVDYSLRLNGNNKVFIEAKKPAENLADYQKQLLKYAFGQGIKLAVLTNGLTWWFYLPLKEGNWEKRRFCAIDLTQQNSDRSAGQLIDLLSRENVKSGKSIENAEKVYQNEIMRSAIPKAWNKIISGPDELLIDLVIEHSKITPDPESVKKFFEDHREQLKIKDPKPKIGLLDPKEYKFKKPRSFTLFGKTVNVSTWKEFYLKACCEIAKRDPDNFHKVLSLRGTKWPRFSKDPNNLFKKTAARKIEGTDIYVSPHFAAEGSVRFCKDVLELLGIDPNDLTIVAY